MRKSPGVKISMQNVNSKFWISKLFQAVTFGLASLALFHLINYIVYSHKTNLATKKFFDKYNNVVKVTFINTLSYFEKNILFNGENCQPQSIQNIIKNFHNASIFVGQDVFKKMGVYWITDNAEILNSFGIINLKNIKFDLSEFNKIKNCKKDQFFLFEKNYYKDALLVFCRPVVKSAISNIGTIFLTIETQDLEELLLENSLLKKIKFNNPETVTLREEPENKVDDKKVIELIKNNNLMINFNKRHRDDTSNISVETISYLEYIRVNHWVTNYIIYSFIFSLFLLFTRLTLANRLIKINEALSGPSKSNYIVRNVFKLKSIFLFRITNEILEKIKKSKAYNEKITKQNILIQENFDKLIKTDKEKDQKITEIELLNVCKAEHFQQYKEFEQEIMEELSYVFHQLTSLALTLKEKIEDPSFSPAKMDSLKLMSVKLSKYITRIYEFDIRPFKEVTISVKHLINEVIMASRYYALLNEVSLEIGQIDPEMLFNTDQKQLKLSLFGLIYLTIHSSPPGSKISLSAKRIEKSETLLIEMRDSSYKQYQDNQKPLSIFDIKTINMSTIEKMIQNMCGTITCEFLGKQGRIVSILLKNLKTHYQGKKGLGSNVYFIR